MEFLKNLFPKRDEQNGLNQSTPGDAGVSSGGDDQLVQNETQLSEPQAEEVPAGTKIKVVAALMVVGFAAYVAYWVQEPVEIRADLLGSGSGSSTQVASEQTGNTQEVSIADFAFSPSVLNVTKGATVIWTNKDTVPHNVVGDDFASPTLNPGESFTYVFNKEGSNAYQCTFHPQMKGYVVVAADPNAPSKDQVLSGFGAGSSLGLDTPSSSADSSAFGAGSATQMETMAPVDTQTATDAATENPATAPDQSVAPAETPAPEPIFTSVAPAPELHNAALQPLSSSLSNVGNVAASAQGSEAMTAEQQQALAAQANEAQANGKGKLASSGPEDYLYAGIFGTLLYLNRKKLRKFSRMS